MVLETKRLFLREMNPDDDQALFLVFGDPETMWHYPYTFDGRHVRDWIERNRNRYRKDGFGLWAVCLKLYSRSLLFILYIVVCTSLF